MSVLMNSGENARTTEDGARNIFGEGYDVRQFWRDLSSGQLRWLSAILSLANVGLLVLFATDAEGAAMDFPLRLKGAPVWAVFSLTLAAWLTLAALNWRAWLTRKRVGA